MKLPIGRFGSAIPARARFIARATADMASFCPITRLCKVSSSLISRLLSASVSFDTGMPVQSATISAISSSPIDNFALAFSLS